MTILYYIHDPMCSWYWAFRPIWLEIKKTLECKISIAYVLGGLAPDTNEPMPFVLQKKIQGIWRKIQQEVPQTQFNFDFWTKNQPCRSTYPACRAILAALNQGDQFGEEIILKIQQAYYLEARNPFNEAVLIELSEALGLNKELFFRDLNAPETQQKLEQQIQFCQQLKISTFPSLVLQHKKQYYSILHHYLDSSIVLGTIESILTA
ncbi:DsbA family protein [Candidatus Nitrosacidococcus sp. I8]|uniref:DsbA family protein n=1 Tax=Candidatus Nitrosacidococcus sp. I8 TaxID=2942908 RepID=UPI002227FC59|nr:DsbA family protein [Candidatus Nitrosacidococcus sp. I8]CAH9017551.1 hypothetical protein NURINAE_00434 [Candidatus Nitrosacidococcus sp. I8]